MAPRKTFAHWRGQVARASNMIRLDEGDERELKLVEIAEIAVKSASVGVVLTYVSGFLIVSSYLNSFGISADASEFLKPRYLYVGFLYMLCYSIVGLGFVFVGDFVRHDAVRDLFKLHAIQQTRRMRPEIRKRLLSADKNIRQASFTLWIFIAFVFLFAVTIQITLLRPQNIKDYLILQAGLLGSFFFYQFTYIRALRNEEWDFASGSVFWLRVRAAVVFVGFAAFISASKAFPSLLALALHDVSIHFWPNLLLTIAVLIIAAKPLFYRVAATRMLTRAFGPPLHYLRKHGFRKWALLALKALVRLKGLGPIRTIIGVLLISVGLVSLALLSRQNKWLVIEWGNLVLAMLLIMTIMINSVRADQLRASRIYAGEWDPTDRGRYQAWIQWVLRVSCLVALYIQTTLSYAYCVYSRIPVEKSGGNYATAPLLTVHFEDAMYLDGSRKADNHAENVANGAKVNYEIDPTTVCNPLASEECRDLILLEETQDTYYFASAHDAQTHDPRVGQSLAVLPCGPNEWKSGVLYEDVPYRPAVIAVRRPAVLYMKDTGNAEYVHACDGPATLHGQGAAFSATRAGSNTSTSRAAVSRWW